MYSKPDARITELLLSAVNLAHTSHIALFYLYMKITNTVD